MQCKQTTSAVFKPALVELRGFCWGGGVPSYDVLRRKWRRNARRGYRERDFVERYVEQCNQFGRVGCSGNVSRYIDVRSAPQDINSTSRTAPAQTPASDRTAGSENQTLRTSVRIKRHMPQTTSSFFSQNRQPFKQIKKRRSSRGGRSEGRPFFAAYRESNAQTSITSSWPNGEPTLTGKIHSAKKKKNDGRQGGKPDANKTKGNKKSRRYVVNTSFLTCQKSNFHAFPP